MRLLSFALCHVEAHTNRKSGIIRNMGAGIERWMHEIYGSAKPVWMI